MTDDVWAIILAAGAGSRFGGPKPLAPWRGSTLLSRAIAAAGEVCADRVIVVTGGHAEAVSAACESCPAGSCHIQHNETWRSGLGSSIACGIRAAAATGAGMALLIPVDQPFISAARLHALLGRATAGGRCVLSCDGVVTGPPAAVPARWFADLASMTGASGLKSVLADFDTLDAPGILRDVDTPSDLLRLNELN